MAFSRAWDENFPLDTQLANLLGQDIREFKVDTKERFRAFGSGLIANRETPEAVFGNTNLGVQFYAEDEGRTSRWDGFAWNTVALQRDFVDSTVVTITNPAIITDGNVITIPANFLVVGAVIDITARVDADAGTTAESFSIFFGSIAVVTTNVATGAWDDLLQATVYVIGANSQRGVGFMINDPASGSTVVSLLHTTLVEDITTAVVVKTRINSSGTGTWHADLLVVRVRK